MRRADQFIYLYSVTSILGVCNPYAGITVISQNIPIPSAADMNPNLFGLRLHISKIERSKSSQVEQLV